MIEALEEMNWHIEHWLLLLPNPRSPEARAILRELEHWVLLSTCDHDGVVCSYRMPKGLAEASRPLLTLALLDGSDDSQVTRVFQKLSGVCRQFLDLALDFEPPVAAVSDATEHLVLLYRPTHDKAQIASAPQWTVVSEFIASAKLAQTAASEAQADQPAEEQEESVSPASSARLNDPSEPVIPVEHFEPHAAPPQLPVASAPETPGSVDDVIDLPGHGVSDKPHRAYPTQKRPDPLTMLPISPDTTSPANPFSRPSCIEAAVNSWNVRFARRCVWRPGWQWGGTGRWFCCRLRTRDCTSFSLSVLHMDG
jgi:hypothetical protein